MVDALPCTGVVMDSGALKEIYVDVPRWEVRGRRSAGFDLRHL